MTAHTPRPDLEGLKALSELDFVPHARLVYLARVDLRGVIRYAKNLEERLSDCHSDSIPSDCDCPGCVSNRPRP